MSMKAKNMGLALATAAAILVTSSAFADANTAPAAGQAATVKCDGANSCKGQSLCATAHNTCKGLNSCKGKGWLMLTRAACLKAGGTIAGSSTGTAGQ